jgi:hypothetical protein
MTGPLQGVLCEADGVPLRYRLQPGVRLVERDDGRLQVGLRDGHRLLLPDSPSVRRRLTALSRGSRELPDPLLADLERRGLVRPDPTDVRVTLDGGSPDDAAALVSAGLEPAPDAPVMLLLTRGAEPRRDRSDAPMRSDRPHLYLTQHAGVTRVGPLVDPGRTACLRCLDAHDADTDPGHLQALTAHLEPLGTGDPADWRLALAWGARDLLVLARGGRPVTWSATVDLVGGWAPAVRTWARHPRCGCAWGDALVG